MLNNQALNHSHFHLQREEILGENVVCWDAVYLCLWLLTEGHAQGRLEGRDKMAFSLTHRCSVASSRVPA